jgi:hypothetical protein
LAEEDKQPENSAATYRPCSSLRDGSEYVSGILLLLTDVEQWQEDATNWQILCTFEVWFGIQRGKVNISGRRVGDVVMGVRGAGCKDVSWIDLP